MRRFVIASIAALAVSTPAQAHPPKSGEPWTNPVLNRDFADPAVLKAPNGWYYAYATQATKSALRPLLIDPLFWRNGWPEVRAGIPSGTP